MAITVVYETECPHDGCDGTAQSRTLHVDQPEADGAVHIDVELNVGQKEMVCNRCDCTVGTGDIDLFTEECDLDLTDEEDDDGPLPEEGDTE
jgi:hypothetical protein